MCPPRVQHLRFFRPAPILPLGCHGPQEEQQGEAAGPDAQRTVGGSDAWQAPTCRARDARAHRPRFTRTLDDSVRGGADGRGTPSGALSGLVCFPSFPSPDARRRVPRGRHRRGAETGLFPAIAVDDDGLWAPSAGRAKARYSSRLHCFRGRCLGQSYLCPCPCTFYISRSLSPCLFEKECDTIILSRSSSSPTQAARSRR